MKSDKIGEQGVRKNKRDRYWSVMLVGDHGRIIPFRRFKGLAIGVVCLLVISIAALIIVSLLFAHQKQKMTQLNSEVQALRQQAAELRDEKDLYLTKLIVKQEQASGPSKAAPSAKIDSKSSKPETPAKAPTPPQTAAKKEVAPPKPAPAPEKVKWAADIRRFKVTYQPDRKVLKAEFRIYNTSKPKKPLAGRTVVVFKNLDDTPIHWFSVPRVQLSNGEPSGARGQAFKINNYRTVQFRAYGQPAPVKYNAATVFIYSDKGQLLVSKEFGFKIAYKPPPKPKVPKQEPVPESVKSIAPTSPAKPKVEQTGTAVTPAPSSPPASPDKSKAIPAPPETITKPGDEAATPPIDNGTVPVAPKTGETVPPSSVEPAPPANISEPETNPKTQGEPL